jgi:cytochrome c
VQRWRTPASLAAIAAFLLWAHFASDIPVFHSQVAPEPGWESFREQYRVGYFGDDGQFVRAVQNGYNLFFHTHRYASRFTRKGEGEAHSACAACHSVEDLAYGFVKSDRFDAARGRRVSFEERVRGCYADAMAGYVPTIYDPAVRDLRLLARAVARHLELGEGVRKAAPASSQAQAQTKTQ